MQKTNRMKEQEKEAIIIAITNNKGGVGKTTCTANIAVGLKKLGMKCLAIDADPQGNLGRHLGYEPEGRNNLYYAITTDDEKRLNELPILTSGAVDIVCSHVNLTKIDSEFSNEIGSIFFLKDVLKPIRKQYDFILIDCPPQLGMITLNALATSQLAIVPIELDIFALEGMGRIFDAIERTRSHNINPELEEPLILMTKFDSRKSTQKKLAEKILKTHNCFSTLIRMNSTIEYTQFHKIDFFEENETSNAAIDYLNVCKELINHYNHE